MKIIGAGLSGLLAGALDRHATIFERQPELPHNHHAVLRFREDKIARALDIPFRKVRVHKAVAGDDYKPRSNVLPSDINGYSRKTLGMHSTRSIIDLSPVDRFVAPSNFIAQLGDMCRGRIEFNSTVNPSDLEGPVISTIPLPSMLAAMGWDEEPTMPEFVFSNIRVLKFTIPDTDVFQTIYFPGEDTPLYRATITRDELILELAEIMGDLSEEQLAAAMGCFGIDYKILRPKEIKRQGMGKIMPINEQQRKSLLYRLTKMRQVYSLGRFACWRNILLDDVFDDYWKVKKMIALNEYDIARTIA